MMQRCCISGEPNIGKTDQKIWENGGMKRFLIFLFIFPAIATASFYAVVYILTGAELDSLSGRRLVTSSLLGQVSWLL
jgi:hypothetical protein